MALLTQEAAEAIEWLRLRIPDRFWQDFRNELDDAMRPVLAKFGFDNELSSSFAVAELVADRSPIKASENEMLLTIRATIYTGMGTYAVAVDTGKIYTQNANGSWRKTRLGLREVTARSITKVDGKIEIGKKHL